MPCRSLLWLLSWYSGFKSAHKTVVRYQDIVTSDITGRSHQHCLTLVLFSLKRFDPVFHRKSIHYNDVIMGAIASQITSLTIVYSTVYSNADQRKRQSSASQAFVRGTHRGPMNSLHKGPVTRKMFPFDDVIMTQDLYLLSVATHSRRCWFCRRLLIWCPAIDTAFNCTYYQNTYSHNLP